MNVYGVFFVIGALLSECLFVSNVLRYYPEYLRYRDVLSMSWFIILVCCFISSSMFSWHIYGCSIIEVRNGHTEIANLSSFGAVWFLIVCFGLMMVACSSNVKQELFACCLNSAIVAYASLGACIRMGSWCRGELIGVYFGCGDVFMGLTCNRHPVMLYESLLLLVVVVLGHLLHRGENLGKRCFSFKRLLPLCSIYFFCRCFWLEDLKEQPREHLELSQDLSLYTACLMLVFWFVICWRFSIKNDRLYFFDFFSWWKNHICVNWLIPKGGWITKAKHQIAEDTQELRD